MRASRNESDSAPRDRRWRAIVRRAPALVGAGGWCESVCLGFWSKHAALFRETCMRQGCKFVVNFSREIFTYEVWLKHRGGIEFPYQRTNATRCVGVRVGNGARVMPQGLYERARERGLRTGSRG